MWPLQNMVPQFLATLDIHATNKLNFPLRDVYPREEKASIHTRLGSSVLTVPLFVLTSDWRQLKRASAGSGHTTPTVESSYGHTARMNLSTVTLREGSQAKRLLSTWVRSYRFLGMQTNLWPVRTAGGAEAPFGATDTCAVFLWLLVSWGQHVKTTRIC